MSDSATKEPATYTMPIVVTLAASFVVVCGLIAVLIVTGHDPGAFLNAVITLVGLLPGLGVISYAITQTAKKTDTVVKNTNGNLSKLQAQINALAAVATPDQVAAANGALPSAIALPVNSEAATAAVQTVPPAPTVEQATVAQVPTPAEIQAAIAETATPVTPLNVTSGAGS